MAEAREFEEIATRLDDVERRVRTAAFRAIYEGRRPSVRELTHLVQLTPEDVQTAVDRLLDLGLITIDEAGLISGSHGLSLVTSEHRVTFVTGVRHVWCAVDAVGIPAAMGVDAEVSSRCFHCGAPVTLAIRAGEVKSPGAASLRISISVERSGGKVNEEVCPKINFFCSPAHAEAWAGGRDCTFIDVNHASAIGRHQWADVVPDPAQ